MTERRHPLQRIHAIAQSAQPALDEIAASTKANHDHIANKFEHINMANLESIERANMEFNGEMMGDA